MKIISQERYGQAYAKGFGSTVRFLCSRGASWATAEDVAQTAWLRGWEQLHQLRDEEKLLSWVNTIAANKHRRASQHDARYQTLPDLHDQGGIDVAAIDAARILTLCRPRDRILFEQQMGGFTTEEIAGQQGVSATAIRIRLMRARREIRSCIEVRGFERNMVRNQDSAAAVA